MSNEQEAIRELVDAIQALDWFVRRVPVGEVSGQNNQKANDIIEQARAAVRAGRACLPEWDRRGAGAAEAISQK